MRESARQRMREIRGKSMEFGAKKTQEAETMGLFRREIQGKSMEFGAKKTQEAETMGLFRSALRMREKFKGNSRMNRMLELGFFGVAGTWLWVITGKDEEPQSSTRE